MGLLTKADAARLLNLTPAAVVALERRGLIGATRTKGGVRLFRESDVLRLATKRDRERAKKARQSRSLANDAAERPDRAHPASPQGPGSSSV